MPQVAILTVTGALSKLASVVPEIARGASSDEIHRGSTLGYTMLLTANAFARVGLLDEVFPLQEAAWKAFGPAIENPVHAHLVHRILYRTDQVIGGKSIYTDVSGELTGEYLLLSRDERYVVDVLRRVSPMLGREAVTDTPVGALYGRQQCLPIAAKATELGRLLNLPPPIRQDEVAKALRRCAIDPDQTAQLYAALKATESLPESFALEALVDALPALHSIAHHKPEVYAEVIAALSRLGYTELVIAILPQCQNALSVASEDVRVLLLSRVMKAARMLGLDPGILSSVCYVKWSDNPSLKARLIQASIGEYCEGMDPQRTFDEAFDLLPVGSFFGLHGTPSLDCTPCELVRTIASVASTCSLHFGITQAFTMFDRYSDVSDALSTNEYFCLSVIHYWESIMLLLTDLFLLNPSSRMDLVRFSRVEILLD